MWTVLKPENPLSSLARFISLHKSARKLYYKGYAAGKSRTHFRSRPEKGTIS